MDDSTYVMLHVHKSFADKAKDLAEKARDCPNKQFEDIGENDLVEISFDEVNYGRLSCLSALRANGIAYDSIWCKKGECEAGTEYARFTPDGNVVVKEIYEHEEGRIDLRSLEKFIDDHRVLKNMIINRREELTILPWDNQIEYGKLYLATQLITG